MVHFYRSILRLIVMRSDSNIQSFIFRSEKRIGLRMQSDSAKSDGRKSDSRIRWTKSSDFGPKSGDSAHRIIKSKNEHRSLNHVKTAQRLVQQQYEVRTARFTSSDRCVGLRAQLRYANAVTAPLCSQTTASCRSTRGRT